MVAVQSIVLLAGKRTSREYFFAPFAVPLLAPHREIQAMEIPPGPQGQQPYKGPYAVEHCPRCHSFNDDLRYLLVLLAGTPE